VFLGFLCTFNSLVKLLAPPAKIAIEADHVYDLSLQRKEKFRVTYGRWIGPGATADSDDCGVEEINAETMKRKVPPVKINHMLAPDKNVEKNIKALVET